MTFTRMKDPKVRTEQILDAAMGLAKSKAYDDLTREEIAKAANVSTGLISFRFGTMTQLRRAIMRRAVRDGVLPIVAQGLAAGDPHARKAPEELKTRALAALR